MRSRILFLSLALSAAAANVLAVDASMLNLLMPDAKVVSGIDIERTRNSPFGEYFLKQVTNQQAERKRGDRAHVGVQEDRQDGHR